MFIINKKTVNYFINCICYLFILPTKNHIVCEDKCIDTLINYISKQIQILNETTLHLAEGMISPPWSRLSFVKDNVTFLNNMLNTSSRENLKLISLSDEVEQNLKKKIKYSFVKVCSIQTFYHFNF